MPPPSLCSMPSKKSSSNSAPPCSKAHSVLRGDPFSHAQFNHPSSLSNLLTPVPFLQLPMVNLLFNRLRFLSSTFETFSSSFFNSFRVQHFFFQFLAQLLPSTVHLQLCEMSPTVAFLRVFVFPCGNKLIRQLLNRPFRLLEKPPLLFLLSPCCKIFAWELGQLTFSMFDVIAQPSTASIWSCNCPTALQCCLSALKK